MYSQKQTTRQLPGIFTLMELDISKRIIYFLFFSVPLIIGLSSMGFKAVLTGYRDFKECFIYFIQIFTIFLATSGVSVIITFMFYSRKAPILNPPPRGWGIQVNMFLTSVIGISFLIGQLLAIFLENITFQEVFFMLGTIIAYILSYVIYFSFTTLSGKNYIILALIQPVVGIILYSLWTAQASIDFFIKAMIFFCTCAFIFAFPYGRKLFQVSNVYREATGIGGYKFIRAFVLAMMTDGNDDEIEEFFDRVGVESDIKTQYLLIRSEKSKKNKGLFLIPHIHFGPFKTCGSSDLPEQLYKTFSHIPGTTIYHTTNTHTQNLTTQAEVNKVITQIKEKINDSLKDNDKKCVKEVIDFSRDISNSAKLIGMIIDKIPLIFLTRHPLPSDDIQAEIGKDIRSIAKSNGFDDIMIIDSHNSIIGDEFLIKTNSIESRDLINVSEKFLTNNNIEKVEKSTLLYGVAKDPINEYSEKDGIGYGGIVIHVFKNTSNEQKTVLIHFDGNNAFLDIRSFILNTLQNKGIEKGEITTSDSHTVARKFTSRGYSPIGDKIKINFILEKLDTLIQKAEKDLEPVDFYYGDLIHKGVKIWGDSKYFDTVLNTLQECIKVSQRLLTLSLIIPGFFSLILLMFYYNIDIPILKKPF